MSSIFRRSFSRTLSKPYKYGISKEYTNNDIRVRYNNRYTEVKFLKTNESFNLSNAFLRDSSEGELSIEPGSGQKLFTTASIIDQVPRRIEIPTTDSILVTWPDGERSSYDKKFLVKYSNLNKPGRYFNDDMVHWDSTKPENFPSLRNYDFNRYMNDDKVLFKVLTDLNKFGIAQINNIPEKSDLEHDETPLVKIIGERIGYIKETFYGTVFDVRTKPNANNIADTDVFLPLHQDLLYYESPPGLQLLHFIKNKSIGGENVFADGYAAAEYVQRADPKAYNALLKIPINYHYHRNGHHYFQSRNLIVEDKLQSSIKWKTVYKEVNYSPPFQAPFEFGVATIEDFENSPNIIKQRELFEDFLRGFKLFEDHINDPKNKIKFKTHEGTCIIFDNRRAFHAREAFDSNSGERWLKGCYLDKDTFQSKLRVTRETNQ